MKKLRRLSLIMIPALILCAGVVFHFSSASAVFNASDVIDDGVFDNTATMSAAQIDSWLNSNFPNSCISTNNGFAAPDPTGYSPASGFTYGPAVSAGQVIYDAGQAYGLNPQVLLATLQKEENLVDGSGGCSVWRYASAVGYGCPDSGGSYNYSGLSPPLYYSHGTAVTSISGTCVNSAAKAGFSQQLIRAAWLLKFGEQRSEGNTAWAVIKPGWDNSDDPQSCYGGPMTQGFRKRCSSDANAVFYDGYTSIDGTSTHMDNGATASLYWYTPHFHGNQSFYGIFSGWFGSTQFPQPLGGLLYYQSSTGKVFLVTTDNNTRYYITNWAMLQNYKLDRYPILPVDDTLLQQYTDGGTLGSLIWDNSGVYLVNNGTKYHVPSSTICSDWALACFDNTVTKQLGSSFQNSYLLSGTDLSNLASYQNVYYRMQGGQRQPIADSTTFSALGFAPDQALYLMDANVTQPLGNLVLQTPLAIKFSSGPTVYFYDGSAFHKFPDSAIASAWGANSPLVPPSSAYDSTPPSTGPDMTRWYQASDGNRYLIDQGRRILLNASQQQLWPSAIYQTFGGTLADGLPQVSLTTYVWSPQNIYLISGGQKHYIPTYDDYLSLGVNNSNTTTVSPEAMSLVAQGTDAFGPGKLVGITGDSKIYVVNYHKLVHIPDPGTFSTFGFDWSKITTYPSSILTDYPLDGNLTATLGYDGNYSYIIGSKRLKMSPQMAADYGLSTGLFKSIEKQLGSNQTSGQAVTKFIYNSDDGKIYYASGGALHYVSSYSAYVGYGGTSIPTTIANTSFLSDFTIGLAI